MKAQRGPGAGVRDGRLVATSDQGNSRADGKPMHASGRYGMMLPCKSAGITVLVPAAGGGQGRCTAHLGSWGRQQQCQDPSSSPELALRRTSFH